MIVPRNIKGQTDFKITHVLIGEKGWQYMPVTHHGHDEIYYIGNVPYEGHVFISYGNKGDIFIYKGEWK